MKGTVKYFDGAEVEVEFGTRDNATQFTNLDMIPPGSIREVEFETFTMPVNKTLGDGDELFFVPTA